MSSVQQETAPSFERRNPVTGATASRGRAMTAREARDIAAAADAAQPAWGATGPGVRRAILHRAAEMLLARRADIVRAMVSEIGATEGWANFNVALAASMIVEAAAMTTQIGGEVIPSDRPGCLAMTMRSPAGVVLSIAPWNAPVILAVRAIATPLACGNAVVFKASEVCPLTHELTIGAFTQSGLPSGLLGLVTNAPETAAEIVGALIDHPAVRRVNFTGSTEVGRIIAVRAATNLKPCLLELGGKAPFLVLEDADLDEAVKAAAFGAFMNQGQICMSTERIIVVDAIADAFVEAFRAKVNTLEASDPNVGQTALGAVVDRKTVARVESLIEDAVDKGAARLTGCPASSVVATPSVVDKVTSDMRLYGEESFGPVVAILRARDEDHAVRLANDTEYGLAASVFTRDIARGLRIAGLIRSGICHINGATVHDEAQMPFGGTRGSGYGRFGGKAGIDAFTELRWITIETQPGHFPI
jgi:benzaldehyde dehydrogenase (NAD)